MAVAVRTDRRRARRPAATAAAVVLGAAALGWAAPSGADVAEVRGGAFGQQVTVSVAGGSPSTSGPAPAVATAPAGGSARDAAPSSTVRSADAGAPFGGTYLRTGLLTVGSWGATGRSGSVTTSATAGAVDALGGVFTARGVTSACAADEAGAAGTVTLDGGRVAVSATETVDLPSDPSPGTTVEATTGSGERVTVVLGDRQVAGGVLVVSAVRIVLHGPAATGEVVLAQARCGVAGAPAPAAAPATADTPPTTAPPAAPAGATGPPTGTAPDPAPAAPAEAAASTPPDATGPPPPAPDPSVGVRAAAGALQEVTVSSVIGGAYGYSTKVSLFGLPAVTTGPAPTVTLPAGGSATPITASAPAANATAGPAILLMTSASSVRTQGTTGVNGSATSSAAVTSSDQDPPGPVLFDRVTSTCTATATGVTGSATISGGVLETKYATAGADRGKATVTEPIPANPGPNTERTGTLDHITDTYRVVYNEQVTGADGSLTVNGVHLYLLGPNGVGDVIVAQSRCGAVTAAVATTSTTAASAAGSTASAAPAASTAASGGAEGAAGGASVSAAGSTAAASSGAAGSTAAAAGASRPSSGARVAGASQSRGAAGGAALAVTGGTVPRLLSLGLLGVALAAARLRRLEDREPPSRA